MNTYYPYPGQDIIDSRDVIAAIDELEQFDEDDELDEDDRETLATLRALRDEASQYAADWQFGEVLIHDGYFMEYAEQLADDIGAINIHQSWPLNHIDWEAAADELKQDYTSVDFGGETYWIR